MNPAQPIISGQPAPGVSSGTPWPGFPGALPSQPAQSTSQDKKPAASDSPAKPVEDDAGSPIPTVDAKNTEPAAAPVTKAEEEPASTGAESPSAPPSPKSSSQTLPRPFEFPAGLYLPPGQPFAPGQALPPGFFPAFPPGVIPNMMLASNMAAKYRTNFQFPADEVDPKQVFNLPPEPYSHEKPKWSYAALIGQALNATKRGRACLDHIYLYILTVYPFYKRGEQAWQNSIRHNLSQNSSFTRLKHPQGGQHGEWAIREEDRECFKSGGYIRPSGTLYAKGQRKRRRKGAYDDDTDLEDDESPRKRHKASKAERGASSAADGDMRPVDEASSQINETASVRGATLASAAPMVVERVSRGKKRANGTKGDRPKDAPFDDVHSGEDNGNDGSVFALPSRREVVSKQQTHLRVSATIHSRKPAPKPKNRKGKGGRLKKRARTRSEPDDEPDDVDELQDDEDLFPHVPPPSYMTGESSVAEEGITGGEDDDSGWAMDEPNNSGSAVHVPRLTPNKGTGASSSPSIESPEDIEGRGAQGVKEEQVDEHALLKSSETGKSRLGAKELAKLRSGTKDLLETTLKEKERFRVCQKSKDTGRLRKRDRMAKTPSSSQNAPQPSTPPVCIIFVP
jgi:Forkhead domain